MSNSDSEISFKPFADDVSQSMLNELTFENQGDCVSIYGSLQITADAQGLAYAKQLARIVNETVAHLEQQQSSASSNAVTSSKETSNIQASAKTKDTDQPQDADEKPFNWDE